MDSSFLNENASEGWFPEGDTSGYRSTEAAFGLGEDSLGFSDRSQNKSNAKSSQIHGNSNRTPLPGYTMHTLEDLSSLSAMIGDGDRVEEHSRMLSNDGQNWSMSAFLENSRSGETPSRSTADNTTTPLPSSSSSAAKVNSRSGGSTMVPLNETSNQGQDSNSSVSVATTDEHGNVTSRRRRNARRSTAPTPPPPAFAEPELPIPKPSQSSDFMPPQPPVASSSTTTTDLDWHNFLMALQLQSDLPEDEADTDYNFEEDLRQDPIQDEEIPRSAIPQREIFDIQNDRTAGTPNSAISDYSEYSSDQVLSPVPPTPRSSYPYTKRQKVSQYAGGQDQNPIIPEGTDVDNASGLDTAEGATAAAAAIAAIAPMATFRRTDLVSVDPWDLLMDQLDQIRAPESSAGHGGGLPGRPHASEEAQMLQDQLQRMRKQMDQHFQLLVQVNLLSRATTANLPIAPHSWQLLGELAGFYNKGKDAEEARNRAMMANEPVPAVFPSNVLFDIRGFHLLAKFQDIVPSTLDASKMTTSVFVDVAELFKDYFQRDIGIVQQQVDGVQATAIVPPLLVAQHTASSSADGKSNSSQQRPVVKWTPAEDLLLVLGLHRYQYSWDLIQANYLPTKDISQIKNRFKNRKKTATANPVKLFWQREMMPATEDEKVKLIHAMSTYSDDFEAIARDCFPNRSANFLKALWFNDLHPMLRAMEMQKVLLQKPLQQQESQPTQTAKPTKVDAPALTDDDMDIDRVSEPVSVSSNPRQVTTARLPPGEDSMAISDLFHERDQQRHASSSAFVPSVTNTSMDIPPHSPVGEEPLSKRRKISSDVSTGPNSSTQPPTPRHEEPVSTSSTPAPIPAELVKQVLLSDPNLLQSVLRDSGFVVLPPSAVSLPSQDAPSIDAAAPSTSGKPTSSSVHSPAPPGPTSPAPLTRGLSNVVDMPDGSRAVFSREEDREILLSVKLARGNLSESSYLEIAQKLKFTKTPAQVEIRSKQLILALTRPN